MPRTQASPLIGFLAVDKSPGWTSHDVVARVRKLSGVRRVGHAGTLDPFATGLLIIGIGKATRLIQYVQRTEKAYETTLKLGEETETFDPEGQVTARSQNTEWPSFEEVKQTIERYVGSIEQIPPAYSAIHVEGRRAYELAKAGEEVEIPARTVTIHSLDVTDYDPPLLRLSITCSTGTYIRSLARDIGRDLGTYAHCLELRRTRVGRFHVEDAIRLEDIDSESFRECWPRIALPPDSAVESFATISLNDDQTTAWYHGQSLRDVNTTPSGVADTIVRVYDGAGEFAGLGHVNAGSGLRPVLVLTTD